MPDIICQVISQPEEGSRPVFKQTTTKVAYFIGDGDISYHCGKCNFVLARNVTQDIIQQRFRTPDGFGLVLECPECKSYNELGLDIG